MNHALGATLMARMRSTGRDDNPEIEDEAGGGSAGERRWGREGVGELYCSFRSRSLWLFWNDPDPTGPADPTDHSWEEATSARGV